MSQAFDKKKQSFFPKKTNMGQMGNLDKIPPNLCNLLSNDPIYRYL